MYVELKGEPENRVDTGTLSLVIAVGVASLLTILVTCCVCAFRCCGSEQQQEESGVGTSKGNGKPRKFFGGGGANYSGIHYDDGGANHHHHFPQHNSPRVNAANTSPRFSTRRNGTPPPQFPPLSVISMMDTTVVWQVVKIFLNQMTILKIILWSHLLSEVQFYSSK